MRRGPAGFVPIRACALALARRRLTPVSRGRVTRVITDGTPAAEKSATSRPRLAIVQHGHQHLITDGYDNHESVGEILDSFSAVLALHLRYGVPLNLHLSGTFIEAAAWHRPEFFGWVRALLAEGLVEVLGSAYAQPILPLFDIAHALRQIAEELHLLETHLGRAASEIHGFWVPERVWDGRRLSNIVASPLLANGGYRWVLLDDRLWYSTESGGRDRFDQTTVPGRSPEVARSGASNPTFRAGAPAGDQWGDDRELGPAYVRDGSGLVAVPISGDLRYAVPVRSDQDEALFSSVMVRIAKAGPGAIGVYADDLEKSAGVGAWAPRPWTRARVNQYERFLRLLAGPGAPEAVLLTPWLDQHPPTETRRFAPGTFYELAAGGAGEDYRGWWDDPAYASYRDHLTTVERVLVSPAVGMCPTNGNGTSTGAPHGGLVDLAWKQLMVASYETAWHGLGGAADEVAPWARATASHVRSAHSTLGALRWNCGPRPVRVWTEDIDRDGEPEVMLANEHVFVVISPRWGGRVVALYDVSIDGGRMVVGNPADDWNWQEELNRHMAVPANHPGAFTDEGAENDRWEVVAAACGKGWAEAVLRNGERDSPLFGSVKRYRLDAGSAALSVTYTLAAPNERFAVIHGLSPDYLHLLRYGRAGLRPIDQAGRKGWACRETAVWVEIPEGEPVLFEPATQLPAGHVLPVRTIAWRSPFRLALACASEQAEIDLRPDQLRAGLRVFDGGEV